MPEPPQITLTIDAGAAAADFVRSVLAAGPVASIAVRVAGAAGSGSGSGARATLADIIKAGQAGGAAMLIVDDADLARDLGADGVHLSLDDDGGADDTAVNLADHTAARYRHARARVGTDAIVGIEPAPGRHGPMLLGEAGADYLAFRASAPHFLDPERSEDDDDWLQTVEWWADIFQVPCIAVCDGDEDVVGQACAAADAGAEFIGLSIRAATPPADGVALVAAVRSALAARPGGGDAT